MGRILRILLLTSCLAAASGHGALVRPLPLLPVDKPSPDYQLRVDGVEVPVAFGTFHGGHAFHHASFELQGACEIRLSGGNLRDVRVVPSRHGIAVRRVGGDFVFPMNGALKLVVHAEGLRPLLLFGLPPETDAPKAGDPNVRVFGPGVHEVGELRMKDGQTLYLAPGAVVKGRLYAFEVENVTIRGRGLWDARGFTSIEKRTHGMLFERCRRVRIEGIQLRTGPWWQSLFLLTDGVRVDHLHTLSFGRNNDGVDVDGVTNLAVRDSFIGCGDDGFGWHAVDAVANGEAPSRDLTAERCVIWNEHAGNGLRLGASLETKLFENVTFRDIDVVHVCRGGYAIMSDHADWAVLRNVLFERFHNESARPLAFLSTKKNRYSNNTGYRDERGTIRDLYFHQVTSVHPGVKLEGADKEHGISEVYFSECLLGGKPLVSAKDLSANPFVSGLHFPARLPERKKHPARTPEGRALPELVIDDGAAGFGAFGGDGLSEESIKGAHGGTLRRFAKLGWTHAAWYAPELEGRYEISIHWVPVEGIGAKTPWTVFHKGGYQTKVFGRETKAGWQTLGEFDLDAASWVRLADPHYQISDGPVVADAVRFRRVR